MHKIAAGWAPILRESLGASEVWGPPANPFPDSQASERVFEKSPFRAAPVVEAVAMRRKDRSRTVAALTVQGFLTLPLRMRTQIPDHRRKQP